jgi:DNA-directed RNA polymerase subunit RPC12/RpoP
MLLEKDKYCRCPHCGNKSFKDVSIVNVKVIKNEWGDDMLIKNYETNRYKCTRCNKEFNEEELYQDWLKQG